MAGVNDPVLQQASQAAFVQRLAEDRPLLSVELRPPRSDLSHARSIDTWIDMHHGIRRVVKRDTYVFLTDNAVGVNEEENLHHLQTNLSQEVSASRLVPILTCKHPLDYCLMYANRAASNGYQALTVLGGDNTVGPQRCLGHAYELRQRIRARTPNLALGGWANPHRDPAQQLAYLTDKEFTADYYLTQVVSHHDLPKVEAFLKALRARDLPIPGMFGVFFYRSARARTLKTLSKFLPVPAEEITREFESGASNEEICARTIRALRDLGVEKLYLSNLEFGKAPQRLKQIQALVDA